MPWKFRDDISNGSGVIALRDRQTNTQTDSTKNSTSLAAPVVNIWYSNERRKHYTFDSNIYSPMVAVWLSGNTAGLINEVTLRRAGLVLR